MKRRLFIGVGAVIAAVGIVWTLQGLGYIGGSVMSGVTLWAVIGPVVFLAGVVVAAVGLRGRGSAQ